MLKQKTKTRYANLRKALMLPIITLPVLLLSFKRSHDAPNPLPTTANIILILDAGHGGDDMGAISTYNVAEKDLNLRICRKMQQLATEYNISVVLTRENDQQLTL